MSDDIQIKLCATINIILPYNTYQLSQIIDHLSIITMSNIFNQQNQMIIRFPEQLADILNQYFQKGGEQPQLTIECDKRSEEVPRISLQVGLNGQSYKASVVQLPTISSTFKTIDRVNFFKSNDISEMIIVHQSPYDDIPESEAERVIGNSDKIKKYMGENGITDATANIRQRFFRKKPKIDHQLVDKVDMALDQIKSQFTKQDDKMDKNRKKKSNISD